MSANKLTDTQLVLLAAAHHGPTMTRSIAIVSAGTARRMRNKRRALFDLWSFDSAHVRLLMAVAKVTPCPGNASPIQRIRLPSQPTKQCKSYGGSLWQV